MFHLFKNVFIVLVKDGKRKDTGKTTGLIGQLFFIN